MPDVNENELTPAQQSYLETFMGRYTQRTQKSKQHERAYRPVFADFRSLAAFRMPIKDICYPITALSGKGAKIWDIDGNEYIDFTMGFGVNLLGHQPELITAVVEEQLKESLLVGPQSPFAGEVAELISELTGMARVIFSNSGTEAVATALRIARAHTGREKMALFTGAFHGHSDATLVKSTEEGLGGEPVFRGVLPKTVEDTLVLRYGMQESLTTLKEQAHELAAILVEPIPKFDPPSELSPKVFLQVLREITEASGTALIFDEVFTGFRAHLGGVQALFGIKADIATYGKVVGGGLPIGVVAGKSDYMDRIDGGMWYYGDHSYPQVEPTFYAGTFCKYPLAMVAARTMLKYLKEQGPTLQQQLNERTSQLVERLNTYFEQNKLSLKVGYHGLSNFHFYLQAEDVPIFWKQTTPFLVELLHYHLIEKGIYIWEGRLFVLSTAHTDEDLEYLFNAVKESVEELQAGGFSFMA